MTDHDVPDFDDPAYDDLRGLLADARVTDPVPADVAARLDATLAGLTGRPVGPDPSTSLPAPLPGMPEDHADSGAEVVPLRKRSLAPRLLVAAAVVGAVAAGGVGLNQVLDGPDTSSKSMADASASSATTGVPAPEADAGTAERSPEADTPKDLSERLALPAFTTTGFAEDAKRYSAGALKRLSLDLSPTYGLNADRDVPGATAPRPGATKLNGPLAGSGTTSGSAGSGSDGSGSGGGTADKSGTAAEPATCTGPVGTDADVVPITLDGSPAALVVHPVSNGVQLIEAWSCDGRSVLVATSVGR